ncbi:MAG: ABC transporter permease [Verrucomicrobiota bacterium]
MACILLGIVAVMAVIGPVISPYGYEETSEIQFGAPSAKHWFGTDLHGRDLFTRVLFGARISLLVGIVGTSISLIVGVSYGIISGYIGGKVDSWMMRLVDVLYALPRIVLVIVVIAVFDSQVKDLLHASAWSEAVPYTRLVLMFISLGMVEWLTMARIVRGQVLSLRSREFIQAAQSLGQRPWKIVGKHLLPNLRGVIIVYLTLTVPAVILEESFLSFLGLGIQPPQSSWGTLLADGASVINPIRSYWWVMMGPALFMAITLFALNYLGDALRDYFELDDQSVK